MAKYDAAHMKVMNTKTVFREFRSNAGLCINDIAQKTKISVPTVSKIVDSLLEKELIVDLGSVDTSIGRKPNLLKINNDKYFSLGVIYEGEYLLLGIVDLSGTMVSFIQVKCGQHFERTLLQNIDRLLEMSSRDIRNLTGIGIGMPCVFDTEKREIVAPLIGIESPKYFGDFIDQIAEKYHVNVIVDNDLNMQAFGEFSGEKLPKTEDMIYISLGTGLGAGVVMKGNMRRGSRFICGEIGYMMFEYTEEEMHSGWLESKMNLQSLKQNFGISEEAVPEENKSAAIAHVSKYMAMVINNLTVCYDAANIVLDGIVFELLGETLLSEIQARLDKICMKPVTLRMRRIVAPGILGAAILAGNLWLEEIIKV